MRIGLHINNFTWPGGPQALRERLAEVVRTADDAGFSFITVMDHFFQIEVVGPVELEMLEGYCALSFLAGATRRVRLGTMVTGVTYRYPGVLIKTVTTLDVLSGGRAFLGLGAAWFEREHVGLGIPILVGGSGEQKTLRLVALYADACNLFGEPEVQRQKLGILKQHCNEIGRPYEEILRTANNRIFVTAKGEHGSLTPAQALEKVRALGEAGVQLVNFSMPNVSTIEPLEIFGREIIPAVADVGEPAPGIWW